MNKINSIIGKIGCFIITSLMISVVIMLFIVIIKSMFEIK